MRYVLILWAAPLGLFWGWFFLSAHDINFGSIYLSRALHELVFEVYGEMLGIDPTTIPWLVGKACIVDTLLILALYAFKRRAVIAAWLADFRERRFPAPLVAGVEGDQARLEG